MFGAVVRLAHRKAHGPVPGPHLRASPGRALGPASRRLPCPPAARPAARPSRGTPTRPPPSPAFHGLPAGHRTGPRAGSRAGPPGRRMAHKQYTYTYVHLVLSSAFGPVRIRKRCGGGWSGGEHHSSYVRICLCTYATYLRAWTLRAQRCTGNRCTYVRAYVHNPSAPFGLRPAVYLRAPPGCPPAPR